MTPTRNLAPLACLLATLAVDGMATPPPLSNVQKSRDDRGFWIVLLPTRETLATPFTRRVHQHEYGDRTRPCAILTLRCAIGRSPLRAEATIESGIDDPGADPVALQPWEAPWLW